MTTVHNHNDGDDEQYMNATPYIPPISRPFSERTHLSPSPSPPSPPPPFQSTSLNIVNSRSESTNVTPSQRIKQFLNQETSSELSFTGQQTVDHGPPALPPGPAKGVTAEEEAAYGHALAQRLKELHIWIKEEQPSLRDAVALQLRLELYLSDCAARCPDLFCTVWRFGDTLDPHDQTRGQRSSFQTLLFFTIMQLRIYVRNLKISANLAPSWETDERPQHFKWLLQQKLVVTKNINIGQLPLSALDQELSTLLLKWSSCIYHPELETYVSRLLDRMAILVCFPHPAVTFGTLEMLQYIQPLYKPEQSTTSPIQEEEEQEEEEEGEEEEIMNEMDLLFMDEEERELSRQRRQARHKANRVARYAAITQAQEEEFARQFRLEIEQGSGGGAGGAGHATDHLYAANFDLMYRCQLRYWQLTRALNLRRLLPRWSRHDWQSHYPCLNIQSHQCDLEQKARLRLCFTAAQIKQRVGQKASTVHQTLTEQVRHYMLHHVTAPEDPWWIAHMIPTSSRVPDAILEKLHGIYKNKLMDEIGRPPAIWIEDKRPNRIGFREYTILQLFDKVLPPEVSLLRKYVVLRDHVERDLHLFSDPKETSRPRLVQFFSRFSLVYKGHVLEEVGDIYEVLSLWLRIVATDFGESRLWRLYLQPFLMDEQAVQEDKRQEIVFL